MKKLILFILLLLPTFAFAQKKEGVLYGKITDENGKAIEFVNVAVLNTSYGIVSDSRGSYSLTLPADTLINVAYSFVGYEEIRLEINLKPGERRKNDVKMTVSSTILPEMTVKDQALQTTTITKLDAKETVLLPTAGAGGVEDMVKTLAGVSSTNELSSQYNVRGGNFDENLIYVNGIEIYKPFLVGSGQQEGLSFINSRLISNIDFSAGGFSAEYGDKLSSVLDITYKKPTETAGSLMFSFLGAEAHAEGRAFKKNMSYLIGARYKNTQYILGNMDTKGDYKPSFIDVQGLITYNITPKFEISALGYYSRNSYLMAPTTRETDFGNLQASYRLKVYFDGQELSKYTTGLGAVTLNYSPNDDLNLKLIGSTYSAMESETFDIQGQYWIGLLETNPGSNEQGNVISNQGVGTYIEHARNFFYSQVYNIDHKGAYKYNDNVLKWGLRYQHQFFDDIVSEWDMTDSAGYTQPHTMDSILNPNNPMQTPLLLNNVANAHNELNINNFDGYLQHSWQFEQENGNIWVLTAGLRANYWGYNESVNVSPRAGIALKPNKRPNMTFRLSGGVYVQPPFYREIRMFDGSLVDKDKVSVQKSYQIVLGHEYNFIAWNRPFVLTTELYYKYLKDIIPYEVDNIRIRYFADQKATGRAYGLDMKINGEFVKGIESWASLSIMMTEEDIKYFIAPDGSVISQTDVNNGAEYIRDTLISGIPRPSDQLLNFAIFFQDYIPQIPSFKVSLKLIFGTGLPFGPSNSERYRHKNRMTAYRRVDIGFSKQLIGDETSFDNPRNPLKYIRNCWLSLEVFNLLGVNNVSSYMWVTDVYNIQYAVPNYLTNRQLNLKLILEF
ncbi:MAG: carboxypeptidase-like regulatory domain-containing protein [Bacteroidales bacterium]|nr:carboxypeptidase-like regulatory domain-containing protein [Bacteroidales bacterium]